MMVIELWHPPPEFSNVTGVQFRKESGDRSVPWTSARIPSAWGQTTTSPHQVSRTRSQCTGGLRRELSGTGRRRADSKVQEKFHPNPHPLPFTNAHGLSLLCAANLLRQVSGTGPSRAWHWLAAGRTGLQAACEAAHPCVHLQRLGCPAQEAVGLQPRCQSLVVGPRRSLNRPGALFPHPGNGKGLHCGFKPPC